MGVGKSSLASGCEGEMEATKGYGGFQEKERRNSGEGEMRCPLQTLAGYPTCIILFPNYKYKNFKENSKVFILKDT